MASARENGKLYLTVRTRFGLVYDGEAKAVSSVNDVGPFDILAGHANFVSMIKQRLVIYRINGEKKEMAVDNGVLVVESNKVTVYLGVTKV